ncbi:hypothetical protein HK102_002782 [Quaeritorhiza haematococci]|nr:hypothetical protein HK102_002782 [Quaeritorhiza haematococci]
MLPHLYRRRLTPSHQESATQPSLDSIISNNRKLEFLIHAKVPCHFPVTTAEVEPAQQEEDVELIPERDTREHVLGSLCVAEHFHLQPRLEMLGTQVSRLKKHVTEKRATEEHSAQLQKKITENHAREQELRAAIRRYMKVDKATQTDNVDVEKVDAETQTEEEEQEAATEEEESVNEEPVDQESFCSGWTTLAVFGVLSMMLDAETDARAVVKSRPIPARITTIETEDTVSMALIRTGDVFMHTLRLRVSKSRFSFWERFPQRLFKPPSRSIVPHPGGDRRALNKKRLDQIITAKRLAATPSRPTLLIPFFPGECSLIRYTEPHNRSLIFSYFDNLSEPSHLARTFEGMKLCSKNRFALHPFGTKYHPRKDHFWADCVRKDVLLGVASGRQAVKAESEDTEYAGPKPGPKLELWSMLPSWSEWMGQGSSSWRPLLGRLDAEWKEKTEEWWLAE